MYEGKRKKGGLERNMKKNAKGLCAILLTTGLLLSGCTRLSESVNNPPETGGGQEESSGTAMGRYMEEDINLEENFYPDTLFEDAEGIHLMSASNLTQGNYRNAERLLTEDSTLQMVDWTERASEELEALISDGYLADIEVSYLDTWIFRNVVIYTEDSYEIQYYFMGQDGHLERLEQWLDAYSLSYWYGGDGYFYIIPAEKNADTVKLYRMSEEGGAAEYITEIPEGNVNNLFVCGDYIFMTVRGQNFYIYSMEKGEYLEDTVLTDAVKGSLGEGSLLITQAEAENAIYVVNNEGLYHHVINGNVMEQVIDGSVCSLGDVSRKLVDMIVVGEEMPDFYMLFSDGKFLRYRYHTDVKSVPDTVLRIYSLEEDRNVRLAVGAFRAEHPELYVQYEIGMVEESGQSREDALKNLATELAVGTGPDILVLDDIPYISYVEKGVLAELTTVMETIKDQGGVWEKLIDDYTVNGSVYGIPMCFRMPVLAGSGGELSSIDSLDVLADRLESLKGSSTKSKIGLPDAGLVLDFMGQITCGEWTTEDGMLDEEVLTRFLSVCKRIYQADIADMTEEALTADRKDRLGSKYNSSDGQKSGYQDFHALNQLMTGMQMGNQFAVGILGGNIRNNLAFYLGGLHELEWDYRIAGESNICLPQSLLGINQNTAMKEAAEEFISFALSRDFQTEGILSGIPMNQGAFQEQITEQKPADGEYYGIVSLVSQDGEDFQINISWPEEEELNKYAAMVEALDTVNLCDSRLFDAVLRHGVDALTGEKEIEETVDAISKEVSLYLAE